MKERLIQLMQLLEVNPTQFASQIGVQRATLQHILSGRNEASLKIVTGINRAYPSVNLQWLLYGKGQAIDTGHPSNRDSSENLIFPLEDMVSPKFQKETSPIINTGTDAAVPPVREMSVKEKTENVRIKEIMVLYEDGTYKKFIPEPEF